MKINRDKIRLVVQRIVELKIEQAGDRKSGLSYEDREMFNRIFNSPEPEPIYQDHFSFSPKWKARHGKTTKIRRAIK